VPGARRPSGGSSFDWDGIYLALQKGCLEERPELVAALERRLYWSARAILGVHADAEDAASETWLKILTRHHQVQHPDRFGPWVHTVLTNECRRVFRRRRWTILADHVAGRDYRLVDDPASASTRLMDLEELLRRLHPREREILVLKYVEDLTIAEIASCLRLPVGTVKSRLARALAAARGHLPGGGADG
jgi:RNA polymerase sigma factor (sigma-70 family)